jgi:hypothetical protein
MVDQLVVITGAGASFECTRRHPFNESWRPPLVVDLYAEREAVMPILSYYPDARTLAPDLRAATRTGAAGLEMYLRDEVLNSSSAYDRRRYSSIPLYLQHLLLEVGQHFTRHPVNYNRLVNASLRAADEVVFLTLNYDRLLDRELEVHTPIQSLDDYVRLNCPWSLVKLHGSVNWVRRITNPVDVESADGYLARVIAELGEGLQVDDEIELAEGDDVGPMRRRGDALFYPALSVPLGPDDQLNCPPTHLEFLRERLSAADGLNILSVGYSGLDSSLLELLKQSRNSLRSLFAVNHEGEKALEVATKIAGALGAKAAPEVAFPGGFDSFAQSGGLEEYVERLSKWNAG